MVFSLQLRAAAHWAQDNLFNRPYPYLTPCLDYSRTPPIGTCPKQLARFEVRRDCGEGHIVYRPNHGMVHSLRVASYMFHVCELFKKYSTSPELLQLVNNPNEVLMLQTMMLFSVSGRVNEAGSAGSSTMTDEERSLNHRNYEESRVRSAENFKNYCIEYNICNIESPEFQRYYHALRYMERAHDRTHQWNPYIHLMGLTHSMDLMRCFHTERMNGLHEHFEWYFRDHPSALRDRIGMQTDIFTLLNFIEKAQRATGNRIFTAVNIEEQYYYSAKVKYDDNLFYRCTENIDFTMDTISDIQAPIATIAGINASANQPSMAFRP